jgi:hypothetical protein
MNTIICGCARNCEEYLNCVFDNIKKIQEIDLINIKQIVLAYDESTDKTLFTLCKIKKEFNIPIEILINKNPLTSQRTQNICNARNILIEHVNNVDYDVEYLIMMDFDDVCAKPIYKNVLEDVLKDNTLWDCVTFNNERYYDFWALSIGDFQYSCWHWNSPHQIIKKMFHYLQEQLNTNTNTSDYIECDSAFNGFAVYKYKMVKHCVYKSIIDDFTIFDVNKLTNVLNNYGFSPIIKPNIYDCEHRYFHLNAKKNFGAKIFIYKIPLFPSYTGDHAKFLYS